MSFSSWTKRCQAATDMLPSPSSQGARHRGGGVVELAILGGGPEGFHAIGGGLEALVAEDLRGPGLGREALVEDEAEGDEEGEVALAGEAARLRRAHRGLHLLEP